MASLHSKSLIATLAIFCCRFTGLLREMCFTAFFGASGAMDAFLSAYRVPNMLRDMFAEGALSQSFTSTMSKVEEKEGRAAAWELTNRIVTQIGALMLVIVALGMLLTGLLMQVLYPAKDQLSFTPDTVVASANPDARTGMQKDTSLSKFYQRLAPLYPEGSVAVRYLGDETDKEGQTVQRFSFDPQRAPQASDLWISERELTKHAVDQVQVFTAGSVYFLHENKLYTQPQSDGVVGSIQLDKANYLDLAAQLCRIMWPFILLASVSAICMGSLNVFGVFGLPNLSSAAFNIVIIVFGSLFGWMIDSDFGPRALYGFAIAVVIGGVAQILIQLPKMHRFGFRSRIDIGLRWEQGKLCFVDDQVKKVWMLMIPGAIAAGITQFNIFINTSFGLYLPSGSVTALTMAFHLWQLPVALFGVAVSMVVLPLISRLVQQGNRDEISEQLAVALRFVAFFAIPSSILLFFWGEQIVSLFFQRGRFDEQSSILTGQVLSAYSLGLFGYAGMKVLQPIFLAMEKPWAPAFLSLASCAVSIGMNYIFVHVIGFGAASLAFTTAMVTTLNFAFYFIFLRKIIGSISLSVLLPGLSRICLAGGLLASQCFLLEYYLMQNFVTWGFFLRLIVLGLLGVFVGGVYLTLCYFLQVPELHMALDAVRKRAS